MSEEEPTRTLPPAREEPTRVRRPGRGSWAALVLATACGFLFGVLVVTTLGAGDEATRTATRRVTVTAARTGGGTVITRALVPAMVGQPLDLAKERAARAKFVVAVDAGGGLFGVVREENWEVVAQRPDPDELLEQGSTVHVDIAKR